MNFGKKKTGNWEPHETIVRFKEISPLGIISILTPSHNSVIRL